MLSIFTCLGGAATGLPALPPPAPLPSLQAAFSRRVVAVDRDNDPEDKLCFSLMRDMLHGLGADYRVSA